MTRKQISTKLSKANKKIENAKEYLSPKEYKWYRKLVNQTIQAAYGKNYQDNQGLSINNIHDLTQIKKIEQASERILSSSYSSKRKHSAMQRKQQENLYNNYAYTDIKTGKIKHYFTKNQVKNMTELFKSEEWEHLISNKIFESDGALITFSEKGYFNTKESAQQLTRMLSEIEQLMVEENASLDDAIEKIMRGI